MYINIFILTFFTVTFFLDSSVVCGYFVLRYFGLESYNDTMSILKYLIYIYKERNLLAIWDYFNQTYDSGFFQINFHRFTVIPSPTNDKRRELRGS